jgi:hypothetical protein
LQKLTIHREGHHAEPDPPCCRCRDRCPCPLDRSGRFLQRHPKIANSRFDNKRDNPDLITAKLPALHLYQLAIPASTPPKDSYNPEMARRGEAVVNGAAKCATCRVPPLFSEPGWPMHTAAEIGIDDFQSRRSPDNRYRTTPLRGLFARSKGDLSRRPFPRSAQRGGPLSARFPAVAQRPAARRSGRVSQIAVTARSLGTRRRGLGA